MWANSEYIALCPQEYLHKLQARWLVSSCDSGIIHAIEPAQVELSQRVKASDTSSGANNWASLRLTIEKNWQ